jgi:hypothetical protein
MPWDCTTRRSARWSKPRKDDNSRPDPIHEQALPYWQHAGEQAVARSANVEAISHFTKGMEVLRGLPVTTERNRHEFKLQLALSTPLFMIRHVQAVEHISQRVLELSQGLEDSVQYFSGLVGLWRFFLNVDSSDKHGRSDSSVLTWPAMHKIRPSCWRRT